MNAPGIVLRDGETAFDHGDPKAPAQGPLTVGAAVLEPLTHAELYALNDRLGVVTADYLVLQDRDWPGMTEAQQAAQEAAWAEAREIQKDIGAAAPAANRADYARRMARIGGAW